MDHLRWRRLGPQRRADQRRVRADRDRPQLADEPLHVGEVEPGDTGQECPLVRVRREGARVDEDGRTLVPALLRDALDRRRMGPPNPPVDIDVITGDRPCPDRDHG
jgi:hypothetical protein